jgi:hypothetical protein
MGILLACVEMRMMMIMMLLCVCLLVWETDLEARGN